MRSICPIVCIFFCQLYSTEAPKAVSNTTLSVQVTNCANKLPTYCMENFNQEVGPLSFGRFKNGPIVGVQPVSRANDGKFEFIPWIFDSEGRKLVPHSTISMPQGFGIERPILQVHSCSWRSGIQFLIVKKTGVIEAVMLSQRSRSTLGWALTAAVGAVSGVFSSQGAGQEAMTDSSRIFDQLNYELSVEPLPGGLFRVPEEVVKVCLESTTNLDEKNDGVRSIKNGAKWLVLHKCNKHSSNDSEFFKRIVVDHTEFKLTDVAPANTVLNMLSPDSGRRAGTECRMEHLPRALDIAALTVLTDIANCECRDGQILCAGPSKDDTAGSTVVCINEKHEKTLCLSFPLPSRLNIAQLGLFCVLNGIDSQKKAEEICKKSSALDARSGQCEGLIKHEDELLAACSTYVLVNNFNGTIGQTIVPHDAQKMIPESAGSLRATGKGLFMVPLKNGLKHSRGTDQLLHVTPLSDGGFSVVTDGTVTFFPGNYQENLSVPDRSTSQKGEVYADWSKDILLDCDEESGQLHTHKAEDSGDDFEFSHNEDDTTEKNPEQSQAPTNASDVPAAQAAAQGSPTTAQSASNLPGASAGAVEGIGGKSEKAAGDGAANSGDDSALTSHNKDETPSDQNVTVKEFEQQKIDAKQKMIPGSCAVDQSALGQSQMSETKNSPQGENQLSGGNPRHETRKEKKERERREREEAAKKQEKST